MLIGPAVFQVAADEYSRFPGWICETWNRSSDFVTQVIKYDVNMLVGLAAVPGNGSNVFWQPALSSLTGLSSFFVFFVQWYFTIYKDKVLEVPVSCRLSGSDWKRHFIVISWNDFHLSEGSNQWGHFVPSLASCLRAAGAVGRRHTVHYTSLWDVRQWQLS